MSIVLISNREDQQRVLRFRHEQLDHKGGGSVMCGAGDGTLDRSAHILMATDERGEIVGVAQTNLARESFIGWPVDVLHASMGQLQLTSLSSPILVSQRVSSSDVARKLAIALYAHLLDLGIALDFAFVPADQAPFYTQLGYRNVGSELSIDFHGCCQLMLLFIHDANHLREVESPFASILQQSHGVDGRNGHRS